MSYATEDSSISFEWDRDSNRVQKNWLQLFYNDFVLVLKGKEYVLNLAACEFRECYVLNLK